MKNSHFADYIAVRFLLSEGDNKTYFVIGNKIKLPRGTHAKKIPIIYNNNFQDEINYSNERNIYLLNSHLELNMHMRSLLLQWIIEVCSQYGFKRDTYYLTVNLIDRFLTSTCNLQTSRFQLLGVAALMLAAKYEEVYLPRVDDFRLMTAGAYSNIEIVTFEITMLQVFYLFLIIKI